MEAGQWDRGAPGEGGQVGDAEEARLGLERAKETRVWLHKTPACTGELSPAAVGA